MVVAGLLGIPPAEVGDIEERHRDPAKQREAILRKWINKEGNAATFRVLYDVLMQLEEKGSAERILGISSSSRK